MECTNCGYINNACGWNDCKNIITNGGFKYVALLSGNEHVFCSEKCKQRMANELSGINNYVKVGA